MQSDFILVKLFSKGLFIGPVWFCYVYVAVSYLRSIDAFAKIERKQSACICAIAYLAMYAVELATGVYYIRDVHSPVCFLSALACFNVIRQLNIGFRKNVNRIAKLTFATYLVQTHMVFQEYLWEGLFRFSAASEQGIVYVLKAAIAIPVIFLLAAIVETVYGKLIAVPWVKALNERMAALCDSIYEKWFVLLRNMKHEA